MAGANEVEILNDLQAAFVGQLTVGIDDIQPVALGVFGSLLACELAWVGMRAALEEENVLARLTSVLVRVGIFFFFVTSWPMLLQVVFDSFTEAGVRISGGNFARGMVAEPSEIAWAGFLAAEPIFESASGSMLDIHWNILTVLCGLMVLLAYALLAIQFLIATIEYYLVGAIGALLIPFGVSAKTAWLSERAIGAAITHGIKFTALTAVISIGYPAMRALTPDEISTFAEAARVLVGALALVTLAWSVPRTAAGVFSGQPGLSADLATRAAGGVASMAAASMAPLRAAAHMVSAGASTVATGALALGAGAASGAAATAAGRTAGAANAAAERIGTNSVLAQALSPSTSAAASSPTTASSRPGGHTSAPTLGSMSTGAPMDARAATASAPADASARSTARPAAPTPARGRSAGEDGLPPVAANLAQPPLPLDASFAEGDGMQAHSQPLRHGGGASAGSPLAALEAASMPSADAPGSVAASPVSGAAAPAGATAPVEPGAASTADRAVAVAGPSTMPQSAPPPVPSPTTGQAAAVPPAAAAEGRTLVTAASPAAAPAPLEPVAPTSAPISGRSTAARPAVPPPLPPEAIPAPDPARIIGTDPADTHRRQS